MSENITPKEYYTLIFFVILIVGTITWGITTVVEKDSCIEDCTSYIENYINESCQEYFKTEGYISGTDVPSKQYAVFDVNENKTVFVDGVFAVVKQTEP